MARHWFGGDAASQVMRSGPGGVPSFVGAAAVTFWSDQKNGVEGGLGGSQYTDLKDRSGGSITSATARADGSLPKFQGPDNITQMWADAGGTERVLVTHTDLSATYAAIYRDRPQLYKPGGLRRWRVALADARNTLAKVMVLGDSITLGVGSDNSGTVAESATYITNAWARLLAKHFQPTYGDPGEGYIKMDDYRWSFGGAAGTYRQDFSPHRKARQMPATSTATITLPLGTTEFDIYFQDNGMKIGVQIDGGAVTTYTGGNTGAPGVRTPTGLAAGSAHTVIITADASNGSNLYVSGIVTRAALTGVQVSRLGEAGADSGYITGLTLSGFVNGSQFTALSAPTVASLMLATFQWSPHLSILPIGVNDAGSQADSGVTPTIYAANLQRLITEATVTRGGCVLLLLGPRLASAATPFTEDQFWAQAYALADANDHVAVMNIADLWGTQAAAQTLGLSIASSVHPNRPGHGDIARVVHGVITAPGLAA